MTRVEDGHKSDEAVVGDHPAQGRRKIEGLKLRVYDDHVRDGLRTTLITPTCPEVR